MKEKHGQFIHIYWEDASDVEFVRGHVTLEEARTAFEQWAGPGTAIHVAGIEHKFARWQPAPRNSDFTSLFHVLSNQDRGAFKVTEMKIPSPVLR